LKFDQNNELVLSRRALTEIMTAVLETGKPFRFQARGWSMSPFIKDSDVISISSLGDRKPELGEIVAFTRPGSGEVVVHRLIGKRGNDWLIQGDNTPHIDFELVPEKNILGRVARVQRNGKDRWSGLGPERYLIAWLSRSRTLGMILQQARILKNGIQKR